MSSAGSEKEKASVEQNRSPVAGVPAIEEDKERTATAHVDGSVGEQMKGALRPDGASGETTGDAPEDLSDGMAVVRDPMDDAGAEAKDVATVEKEAKEVLPGSPLTSVGLDVSRIDTFELGNYTFGRKETECSWQEARGVAAKDIAAHREKRFLERGMRRSVAAVLLVHTHNFPHVLLLQSLLTEGYFLPGGRLRPGECEEDGLRRKLTSKLSPVGRDITPPDWDIGDQCTCRFVSSLPRRMRILCLCANS